MSPRNAASVEDITVIELDFSGVGKKRQSSSYLKPGDYLFAVTSAKVRITSGDEDLASAKQRRFVSWGLRVLAGPSRGILVHNTSIQLPDKLPKDYLWNIRGFIEDLLAGSATVPDSKVKLDISKYIGKQIGAVVADDKPFVDAKNKSHDKSMISATYPASEYIAQFGAPAANDNPSASETDADADEDEDEPTAVQANAAAGDDDDEDDEDLDVKDLAAIPTI